jgi:hypothetical protein
MRLVERGPVPDKPSPIRNGQRPNSAGGTPQAEPLVSASGSVAIRQRKSRAPIGARLKTCCHETSNQAIQRREPAALVAGSLAPPLRESSRSPRLRTGVVAISKREANQVAQLVANV